MINFNYHDFFDFSELIRSHFVLINIEIRGKKYEEKYSVVFRVKYISIT